MPNKPQKSAIIGKRQELNKLYCSKRWRRMSKNQLAKHPNCQCPKHKGKYVPAQVADHIKPHNGDTRLFFDPSNLQSLTKSCHDGPKQTQERSGYWPGCDESGLPEDPEHVWNRE